MGEEFAETAEAASAFSESVEVVEVGEPAPTIEKLFSLMCKSRGSLLTILEYCKSPQTLPAIEEALSVHGAHSFTVYSAIDLCLQLERAGAISLCDEQGQVIPDEAFEPEIVVVDGVEYSKPAPEIDIFFMSTQAGLDYLSSDNPGQRIIDLLQKKKQYFEVYKKILDTCLQNDGARIAELEAQVDNHPLIQNPRFYTPYFVEELERAGALEWSSGWRTTQAARDALAECSYLKKGEPHAQ